MTRTEELLALTEAATSPYADDWELKAALLKFDRAANPETIRQLVELVRLQHDALEAEAKYARRRGDDVVAWVDQALAAFNKWENGK